MFLRVNVVLLPSAQMKERVGAEINKEQAQLIIKWQVCSSLTSRFMVEWDRLLTPGKRGNDGTRARHSERLF